MNIFPALVLSLLIWVMLSLVMPLDVFYNFTAILAVLLAVGAFIRAMRGKRK